MTPYNCQTTQCGVQQARQAVCHGSVQAKLFAPQSSIQGGIPPSSYQRQSYLLHLPYSTMPGCHCPCLPQLSTQMLNWTQANLHKIQWHMLAMALNSFPRNNQCRIVLFLHNKLPLCSSKFHPHLVSILCPSCCQEPKDYWHFLECDHPDRCRLFENLKTQ